MRRLGAAVAVCSLLVMASPAAPPAAGAAATVKAWTATDGGTGAISVRQLSTLNGSLALDLHGVDAGRTYAVALYRARCSGTPVYGTRVTASADGEIDRTLPLSAAQVRALAGKPAVKMGSTCRVLTRTFPPMRILSISVAPSMLSLTVGGSDTLATTVRWSDGRAGTTTDVRWTSSDPAVATVDANGLVNAIGTGTMTITGAGGTLRASTTVTVQPAFTTRGYRDGPLLVLENSAGSDVVRIGVDTSLGGAVALFSLNGKDVVAKAGYGSHLIAVGFYDGDDRYDDCNGCTSAIGWNPTESCDYYRHGSPILDQSVTDGEIYVKSAAAEWRPDDKGGGPDKVVASDLIVERWITPVPNHPYVFQERYRLTHTGTDSHAEANNAVASYEINADYDTWVYDTGTKPGTGGALTTVGPADLPQWPASTGIRWLSELWGGWADAQGFGFAAYAPQGGPPATASQATISPTDRVSVFSFLTPYSFSPGSTVDFTTFLMLGQMPTLQRETYDIARRLGPFPDTAPPEGVVELVRYDGGKRTVVPQGATISGTVPVEGFAFDGRPGRTIVELLVDGKRVASGVANIRRPDVTENFGGGPPVTSGFAFTLDTTRFSDGEHVVQVKASDAAGNVGVFARRVVTFAN